MTVSFQNSTNVTEEGVLWGWTASSNDRGTIDILWSSCVTIVLCCWVSTYPNVGSYRDKWYHPIYDKICLAMIALLGPDFLFGIAYGQFCSARRSVKLFEKDKHLCQPVGSKWTYTHAFLADMGGIHISSPDFPEGFPIDAQQLHYLVFHGHFDFPDISAADISERNTLDRLSRLIAVFQAFWFFVTEIQRARIGLPMTTLELTAISFSFIMFATSLAWYSKPCITRPRTFPTKGGKTVSEIRTFARQHTHPDLPLEWHRTPLDFAGPNNFNINAHWRYYIQVSQLFRFSPVSRPITARPWDRFPSDTWFCPDAHFAPAAVVLLSFSVIFLVAWNFYFPTYVETTLWRVCSAYHAVFTIYGGVYYTVEMSNTRRLHRVSPPMVQVTTTAPATDFANPPVRDEEAAVPLQIVPRLKPGVRRWAESALRWLRFRGNIHSESYPDIDIPRRLMVPVTVTCVLYVFCRLFIYIEDFCSLRLQPAGVYLTVNKFIPFLVGG